LCKYCGKELIMMKIKMPFGEKKEKFFTATCECVIAKRKKQDEENQKQKIILLLKKNGFETGKYSKMTFNNWKNKTTTATDVSNKATDYINFLALNKRNWLYLFGDYGLGKTHISVASARKIAIKYNLNPSIVRWVEYCNQIQDSWHDKSINVDLNWLMTAQILVLDDIDKKNASEWTLGRMYDVLDYRYINDLPTIITANRSITSLLAFWSKSNETQDLSCAIISRIMGQLEKVIHFKGKDYRFHGGNI